MPYSYDDSDGLYRDESGRSIPWSKIRGDYLRAERNAEAIGQSLTGALQGGAISLAAWQREMRATLKNLHVSAMMIASGGRDMMTPETRGAVGGHLSREYRALNSLALRIQSGDQKLDGTLWRTVRHYIRAARKTFYDATRRRSRRRGFDAERSVRTAAERSCQSCITEESRGWVPIGSLIPIGDRTCRRNCLCLMYFRNSSTGIESGPF